jgi:ubiquinone/menaquinone biosynthesis C-methylase UbiE
MDYDKTSMPANYDAGRSYAPAVLAYWLNVVSRHTTGAAIADILDLGCGTGRYSEGLASHFGARVIAIDPSEKMLAVARMKAGGSVRYERAQAEKLPIASASIDMIFISMALHHFGDAQQALRECGRVLRPAGLICLRAGTSEQIENYPYLPYFPSSREIIERMLQSKGEIETLFEHAGFRLTGYELVSSQTAASWSEYADKVSYRADSILTQLSDPEFAAGLEALRAHASTRYDGQPVVEPVDFFVFRRSFTDNR